MRFITIITIAALATTLVGCGKYHGKYGSKYYKDNAQALAPITVPRGINTPVSEQYYAIPWKANGNPSEALSLLPPDPTFIKKYNEVNRPKK